MLNLLASGVYMLLLSTSVFYAYQLKASIVTGDDLVAIIILIVVVFLLSLTLYRSSFHPLAKYSGPWWAAITDFYTVYHIVKGDRHIDFYHLHEKYGDIVRFGPRRISIRSASALGDIYAVNANVKRSQTYESTAHFFGGTPSSNTTPDMKEHAFRRRVNVHALNPANIKLMEEQILKNIRYFCEHLIDVEAEGWSSPRDMSRTVGYLVSDIMGDITFSKSWEVQKKPDNRDLLISLPEGVAGIHLVGYMPELLKLHLDKILFRRLNAGISRFINLSASTFQWRFVQKNCNDLFSALMEARDPDTGKGFSPDQLVSEAGLLTIAGSDTTITAITATFFYLLQYPDCLLRLNREIRSTFDTVEDIRIGSQLSGCYYLLACIKESLRLTPPVGSTLMREVLPGGFAVDGELFPPGTDLGVPHYALHHHKDYYPEPFAFKPERWLVSEASPPAEILINVAIEGDLDGEMRSISTLGQSRALATSAFTAFGSGRTSCIGKYLAYQEISLTVARTLWLYDMRLEPGSRLGEGSGDLERGRRMKKDFQTKDRFVSVHEGPSVQFKQR